MGTGRRIYFCDVVTDFLQHLLDNDASTTTLVICSTRDLFLEQLFAATRIQSKEATESHQLCTKTIGLLSKSRKIRLVFCPTIEHLRAYLSVFSLTCDAKHGATDKDKAPGRPLMAILNPLTLHLSTSEFSAQGLSRTLATAVEVSSREGMDLVLCECQDATDYTYSEQGESLWYTHVPLLNGSVQNRGEDGAWRGRGVPVKRVAQRWFEFNEEKCTITDTTNI